MFEVGESAWLDAVMPTDIAASTTRVYDGDPGRRRALGAYYTPPDAAHYMATWALEGQCRRVLEPSMGDGVFLDALSEAAEAARREDIDVTGVEIDPDVSEATASKRRSGLRLSPLTEDFLAMSPAPHDAVIGNPPYVRLRNLPDEQRRRALRIAEEWLGVPMDPSGSTWMPFVLHAAQCLRPGGRMALVLPYEFTYVRYGRPLWEFLGDRFGSLRVVRTFERLFPDILQDVVLLFASEKGKSTHSVEFEACNTFEDFREGNNCARESLTISDIVTGRPFVSALLSKDLRELMDGRLPSVTQRAGDIVEFRIGYVSGDKEFFHPSDESVAAFGLTSASLRPTVASARRLRGEGLWTATVSRAGKTNLFYPDPENLTRGDEEYIAAGAARGVDRRYKCRIRDPWFAVPYVRVPDVILTVFSDTPLLMANDGKLVASNSLLCGYSPQSADAIAGQWYTSLTLLYAELQVHSLGGGVFVLVPREAGGIRMATPKVVAGTDLDAVHRALLNGDAAAAYRVGDMAATRSGLLSGNDVELIRSGIGELARWRRSGQ